MRDLQKSHPIRTKIDLTKDPFPIDRTGHQAIDSNPGIAPTARETPDMLLLQDDLTPTARRDPFPIAQTGHQAIDSRTETAPTAQEKLVMLFLENPQGNDKTHLREVAKELGPIIQAAGQPDVLDKVQGRQKMANQKQGALNRFITKKRKNSWFDRTPLLILFPFL
jgi:hypothetical protein